MKLEFRAMTISQRMRDSAVMISSTMPSAKYSCSGSPLRLTNGSTAIDGREGRGGSAAAGASAGSGSATGAAARRRMLS
jgi:hypothetical protein